MDKNIWIWCIIAYVVGVFINKTVVSKRKKIEVDDKTYCNKIISGINRMDGSDFEDFVGYIFKKMGLNAKATKKTRDGGKDFILNSSGGKIYVEVKRYADKNLVSSSTVLKLIGSAVSDGVKKCLFITTSGFTKDAMALANGSKVDIELVDIDGFLDMCKKCDRWAILSYLGEK